MAKQQPPAKRIINPKTGRPYGEEGLGDGVTAVPGRTFIGPHPGDPGTRTPSSPRPEFGGTQWNWGLGTPPPEYGQEPYDYGAGVPGREVTGDRYQAERELATGSLPSDGISQPRIDAEVRSEEDRADIRFPLPGGRLREEQYGVDGRGAVDIEVQPAMAFEDEYGVYDWQGNPIDVGLANLTPAGQEEFAAAARGEIPGYSIQDPGARAAFSRARMEDPNFGRRDSRNSGIVGDEMAFSNGEYDPELSGENEQRRRDRERGRAGGMPAGPLTDFDLSSNRRSRRILHDRLYEVENRIAEAEKENRNPSSADIKLRDNLRRVLKARGRYGDVLAEGRGNRPYRMQTGHVGSARGGGPLNSPRVKRGGGPGGFTPGVTPAYDNNRSVELSGRAPSGPLPDTLQESVSPDGSTFTTSDGFSFPNVTGEGGMSQEDFADAMASNPQADDELLEYAENNGLISDAVREKLNSYDSRRMPAGLRPNQRDQWVSETQRERGALLYGIAMDASRYQERQRAASIRAEAQAAAAERSEQSRQRSRMNRLRRIYWANVNQHTSPFLIDGGDIGGLQRDPSKTDTEISKAFADWFGGEDPTKRPLTPQEYAEAERWEQNEIASMEAASQIGKSGSVEGQQSPTTEAPVAATGPVSVGSTGWVTRSELGDDYQAVVQDPKTGKEFDALIVPDFSVGLMEDGNSVVAIKIPAEYKIRAWAQDNPDSASGVYAYFVPDRSRNVDIKAASYKDGTFYILDEGGRAVQVSAEDVFYRRIGSGVEQPANATGAADNSAAELESFDPFANNGNSQ